MDPSAAPMRSFTSVSKAAARASISACHACSFSCITADRARRSTRNSSSNTESFFSTSW